jgi:hypothetical protein
MIPLNKELFKNSKKNDNENPNENTKNINSIEQEKKLKNHSKFEYIVEYLFLKFSSMLRIIGPLFAFCLIIFVIIVARTVFYLIIPYWMKNIHKIFGVIFFIMAIYLLFSILFNYLLAVLVKPGSLEDIKNSKFYRKNDPLKISNAHINFENCKLAENMKNFNQEIINKANEISKKVKLRFKTNEGGINSFNKKFDASEDMQILEKNLQVNLNSNNDSNNNYNQLRKINFNFENENEQDNEMSLEDINNYNMLMNINNNTNNKIGN